MNLLQLLSVVPWEAWFIIAFIVVLVVWVRFGNTAAATVGALAAGLIAYMAGRKAERTDAKVEDTNHANDIQTRAEDARASAERIPDGELRKPSSFQRD